MDKHGWKYLLPGKAVLSFYKFYSSYIALLRSLYMYNWKSSSLFHPCCLFEDVYTIKKLPKLLFNRCNLKSSACICKRLFSCVSNCKFNIVLSFIILGLAIHQSSGIFGRLDQGFWLSPSSRCYSSQQWSVYPPFVHQDNEGHHLGYAGAGCTEHDGLWLRLLQKYAVCRCHDLPIHVS